MELAEQAGKREDEGSRAFRGNIYPPDIGWILLNLVELNVEGHLRREKHDERL